MALYWSNKRSPQKLPLIGLEIRRWTDSEYIDCLYPGYHIRIEWHRTKWWGCDKVGDEAGWVRRGKPLCYKHIVCIELNWPRIWWR